MKYLLLILLVLIPVYSVPSAYAEAQPLPSSFFCIGDNPQPPCITPVPTITAAPSTTCTPPTGCFKNGVMFCLRPADGSCTFATPTPQPSNPSPSSAPISTNPSPSTSPCEDNQSSVNSQNAGNASVQAFKKKGGKVKKGPGNGFISQFFQFLMQLFQLFFQQLGNQTPGTTSPTPTPAPSGTPVTNPSTNPCPSASPSTSSAPSSSPTVSTAPSSANVSPTSPQTSSSPAVSPTPESSATPTTAPSGNPSNNLLQQLIQLLLQLIQQLIQLIGGQAPGGTPTPTPSVAPSGSVSQSPSSAPSPSENPTPTIFGTTPVPTTSPAPSASQAPSSAPSSAPSTAPSSAPSSAPSTATSPSTAPVTAITTGLLMSNIKAGTSTTNVLCLDDKGNSSTDNNPAITWACNVNDKAQTWSKMSDDSIRHNGKCLDVSKHGKADRTAVNLFTCNGGKNQQWKLVTIQSGAAKGKTQLVDQNSQKCLDIKAASTANGTPLEIFTCNGGNNQAWAWGNGTTSGGGGGTGGGGTVKDSGQLKSGLTAKQLCLDSKGNTAANGTIAQTYLCNSKDTAQQWKGYSDGTIKFAHGTTTACLDVKGQGKTNGTVVDLYQCNGGKNQVWTMNGSSQLVDKNSGKCLDIKGASTASPGPQLEIYTCKTSGDLNNQKWTWGSFNSTGGTTGGGGGTTTQWAYLAPTGLKVTSHTSTSVSVSWNAVTGSKPAVPGGVAKPKTYTVAIYTASTGKLMKQVTSALNATTASVTGLTANSTINIHVWANGGPLAPPNAALNNYKL